MPSASPATDRHQQTRPPLVNRPCTWPGTTRGASLCALVASALTFVACLPLVPPPTADSQLPLPRQSDPAINPSDLAAHVRALTDERTQGRRAGTDGERIAADYLARVFAQLDLTPEGPGGSFLHSFVFTSGVQRGPNNTLDLTEEDGRASTLLTLDQDWRPLAFSRSGAIPNSPIIFAGYGLVAPEHGDVAALNDYQTAEGDLDVQDKWVLVFRGVPESLDGERRQFLRRHASLRYKAMVARDRGAVGILFVSGPLARYREELVPLRFDASIAGTRISVLSLSNSAASKLISDTGRTLEALQVGADTRILNDPNSHDHATRSFVLPNASLSGNIDLETLRKTGVNVVARLQVGATPSPQTIVVGAHFDHLGHGEGSSSLATGEEVGQIHPGADDNASGTALVLEVAEWLTHRHRAGLDVGQRDFIFAAWSGEELGLLGSDAWISENANPHSNESGPVSYLNFDMVGRLTSDLIVQGLGSSPDWTSILNEASAGIDLSVVRQQDSYLPTDATSFYTQGVPVLSAFTGVHGEYHTPRDTADKLNLDATVQIGELFSRIAQSISSNPAPPIYQAQKAPAAGQGRGGFRVFLGTIPDYAQTDVVGVRLSGVAPAGPAEAAGLRRGDIIIEVDGRAIENLYDYTFALEALRVGVPTSLSAFRGGERVQFEVVPTSRD